MSNAKPEGISSILGDVQRYAEAIERRIAFATNPTDLEWACFEDAEKILRVLKRAQSAVLQTQLTESLQSVKDREAYQATVQAITSVPDSIPYAMNAMEIADVVRKADSNLKQIKPGVIEVQGKDESK